MEVQQEHVDDRSKVNKDESNLEHESDSSDDNIFRGPVSKQNLKNISDSDSDLEKENKNNSLTKPLIKSNPKKSRIKTFEDSDSDSVLSPTKDSPSLIPQVKSSRIESKRKILHNKFKKLVTSPSRKESLKNVYEENYEHKSDNERSDMSEDEISCLKIKKNVNKMKNALSSICDADSSDEEMNINVQNDIKQHKLKYKSIKSNDKMQPKMSAKQAIENMQKIKSESNRMLREKDVTLPYHKPKALSLRDIMNRRKPTLTSDGKAMPIKMNNEQLQRYAKLLEERQKEMIELCKSESEEEETTEKEEQINIPANDNLKEIDEAKEKENQSIENNTDKLIEDNINSEYICNEIIQQTNVDISKEYNSLIDSEVNVEIQNNNGNESNVPETSSHIINTDSQSIALHLNSENTENITKDMDQVELASVNAKENVNENIDTNQEETGFVIEVETENMDASNEQKEVCEDFMDDEDNIELEDIDKIIENAEILKDSHNCETTTKHSILDNAQTTVQPKIIGTPGMFIDLETGEEEPKKLTGIELLKERFEYFSKLKSLEDSEKNREKKLKPGTLHLKLKHQLEEEIAEQRSLEWEKRLEEEKKLKSEMQIDSDDEIEKIEAKLEDKEMELNESSSSEEEDEDLVENDIEIKDKPRKNNPMIDDEAEVSDEDDNNIEEDEIHDNQDMNDDTNKEVEDEDDSSDDTSSESEDESFKPKMGRILKAFEDSDDEPDVRQELSQTVPPENTKNTLIMDTQDDEIQLAQMNRSISEDIFGTQETDDIIEGINEDTTENEAALPCTADLGSQTFSIMNSVSILKENFSQVSSTQSIDETKFDSFGKKCSESLSQNLLCSLPHMPQSQDIGDDIAAMCTGKFYDNAFVSQIENIENTQCEKVIVDTTVESFSMNEKIMEKPKEGADIVNTQMLEKQAYVKLKEDELIEGSAEKTKALEKEDEVTIENKLIHKEPAEDGNLLKSILDELNEPEIETKNKYFVSKEISDVQIKKRFVIESDDENDDTDTVKIKKLKKRKREKRALQISDDEDEGEDSEQEEEQSAMEDEAERLVEYDSEENEIEVMPKPGKKKRVGEFFENEAELTSEDEWLGSGDEDEGGLDRMEREEGDSDVFHQGQLQKELGQIHMREVLDQDKREVRLLQELLFEDGDLGDGHRQRKFRWRTDEDGEESGMGQVDLTDTQEEEFESEELWRKQRHEREVFLRSMQESEEKSVVNTSINRTAIIKANLNARTEYGQTLGKVEETGGEKKTHEAKSAKDLPSPKKSFMIFQQNYHGSLLTRGRGALARLAALATPLAENDGTRAASTAAGNFVFAALTPDNEKPKVTKRKAEANVGTPRLLKKMKTDDAHKYLRNSLFDHFKT